MLVIAPYNDPDYAIAKTETFVANGTATEFVLSDIDLDKGTPMVLVNGNSTSSFTVNTDESKLVFNSAPEFGAIVQVIEAGEQLGEHIVFPANAPNSADRTQIIKLYVLAKDKDYSKIILNVVDLNESTGFSSNICKLSTNTVDWSDSVEIQSLVDGDYESVYLRITTPDGAQANIYRDLALKVDALEEL